MKPTLFIFAGLPGTGKTTLARRIAHALPATYVRIDTLEQGLRDLCRISVHGEGYGLAYRIAQDNLALGQSVVADSCNPIGITRDEWENVARRSKCEFLHIEVICSDPAEHQRRVEIRAADITGLPSPTWPEIQNRDYHAWDRPRHVVDTARKSENDATAELLRIIHTTAERK